MLKINMTDLAAALLTLGHPITQVELEGETVIFSFEDSPSIEEDYQKFFRGECLIDAKNYSRNLKTLKQEIWSIKTQAQNNTY